MHVTTVAEQLFFVTVNLTGHGPDGTSHGTGFIYAVETDKGTAHFLVTNKHVLDGAVEALGIRLVPALPDGQPAYGERVEVQIADTQQARLDHPSPHIDVAALPFSSILEQLPRTPFFRSIPESLVLTPQLVEQHIDALEEVTFVGYPNNIFDATNFTPIARTGMTATPIAIDFNGVPMFLIDASVFPGSSGSPVFLMDKSGSFRTKDGNVQIGGRFFLLGILAAVATRDVEGQLIELPTKTAAMFEEPIDLGVVFKATTLEDIIDPALTQAGLNKVPAPISQPGDSTPADDAIADAN